MAERAICKNKKAWHDYEIDQTYEAGVVLQGSEVKSCREGRVNLKDSYAKIKGEEVFLIGAHISPYPYANQFNHLPLRERKLLLHKREIKRLFGKVKEKGFSLIPLQMYFKNGKVKLEMALAKGKKLYDKREDLKRRAIDREMERGFSLRR